MLRIAIIVGSTRPGRVGAGVGEWAYDIERLRDDAGFELLEVADFDLPVLDEGPAQSRESVAAGPGDRIRSPDRDTRAIGWRPNTSPRPPRLRRSPVDGWATYVATARVLTREGLVNRELLDVRGSLQLGAGGGYRGSDPRLERVEVLA